MNDRKMCRAVAELWVDNGGDADGLMYCISDIRDAVQQVIDERSKENDHE